MNTLSVLRWVQWGMVNFGSVITSRQLPLRDVLREVKRGYVKSIGQTVVCDDEGRHLDPERHREGFVLTSEGTKQLAHLEVEYEERMKHRE